MKKDKVSLGMEPVFNDTGGGKGGGSKGAINTFWTAGLRPLPG